MTARIATLNRWSAFLGMAALVLSLLHIGCESVSGTGDADTAPEQREKYSTVQLDYFTMTVKASMATWDTSFRLTDEGRKYYRPDSPEAGFPADSGGAYYRPAVPPDRWTAFLCSEGMILSSQELPEAPLAILKFSDQVPIYFSYAASGTTQCSRYFLEYHFDKGFLIPPRMNVIGTLTISYQ